MNKLTKRLVPLAVAALGSAAMAAPTLVRWDDSSFDYSATSSASSAYLVLGYDGRDLTATFTERPVSTPLPAVTVDAVPATGKVDIFGADVFANASDLSALELIPYGSQTRGFTLTFQDTALAGVVTGFQEALGALGFSGEAQLQETNVESYLYRNGDSAVRATFVRQGADVTVTLTGA